MADSAFIIDPATVDARGMMIHAKRLPENCNLAQSARQLVRFIVSFYGDQRRKWYSLREIFAESNETRFSVAKIVISHLISLICNPLYADSNHYDYRYIRSLLLVSHRNRMRVYACACKSDYKSCRVPVALGKYYDSKGGLCKTCKKINKNIIKILNLCLGLRPILT